MIIESLSAENLLKYQRLDLPNLPARGIIAISGLNESGKSSIGEAMCFALFGRTFAVRTEEARKLIRWGESRCSVTLGLSSREGVRYQISRSLDRDDNHSARLYHTDDPEHPLARGRGSVTEALRDLLGYDFEEFIDSFYLAQREITTPHPHSHAIRMMAGVAPMATCREELRKDMEHDQAALERLATRSTAVDTQFAELAFDGQRAHVLAAEQTDLTTREQAIKMRRQGLSDAALDYQSRESRLLQAETSRGTAATLRLLSLLGAVVALGGWGFLTQMPSHPLTASLRTLLESWVAAPWLLYGGLACAILFVLSWMRVLTISRRMKALRNSGVRLGRELTALDELEASLPEDIRPGSTVQPSNEGSAPGRMTPELRDHLMVHLQAGQAAAAEVRGVVEQETAWLDQALGRLTQRLMDLKQEIRHERERRQEYDRLSGMHAALREEEAELQHRIQVRTHADELLHGAMRHLSHSFNHHLRNLVGRTLPMFTADRYQHLQIDEDLTVRAFSNEKRDFMDLDEISSGTQRQIMLALRLSLSQQLINRVVQGNQFIFLDEPFAFFDDARTRSTLAVLPRLSNDITQIWIVAQQFPGDLTFERRIECQRERNQYRDGDSQ